MRYRVISSFNPLHASGTGVMTKKVCIEGKYHTEIDFNEFDSKYLNSGKISRCSCGSYRNDLPDEVVEKIKNYEERRRNRKR